MRRANGTGSIVNLGPNRRRPYAVRVSYLARPGLWKQRYLSYHRTSREAQDALEAYNRQEVKPRVAPVTLQEVYGQWSARKYTRVGSASVVSYRASWARLASLAERPMDRITVDDLQQIIDDDEANGMSKSSITNDKILMKALYKFAMERDIVRKDCSAFVELPTVGEKREKGAFDEQQIQKLKSLAESGFPWVDAVLMLCYTGFRITEFLTLTPAAYHAEGGYLQGGLKTKAGRDRIVPVHPQIKPYLDQWLSKGAGTIICRANGRPVPSKWFREKVFPAVVHELGADGATPHWCRHTAASRMKVAGVDELAVKRILGHADKDVTEHYTHTDIDFLSKEIRKVL